MNQASTHKSSLKKTIGEVFDSHENVILFGPECRVAVEDRQNQRCRSTMKMLIPSRGTDKQVTSQKDGFCDLRLVEPFDRAFTESFIGSPAHPTPTEMFSLNQKPVRRLE